MRLLKPFYLWITQLLAVSCLAQEVKTEDAIMPRLSPMPYGVSGTQQAQSSLNGEWSFRVNTQSAQGKIQVPGEWEMQGFRVNEGETAIYSRILNIPVDWKNKRIKLRFDGVSSHAVVRINGIKLREHEGSFVPFEVDITSALKQTGNILQVEVQALTISDILACTSQYAAHTVGGILRNVFLFALPETNISRLVINTVFDKQYKNATLQLSAQVANELNSLSQVTLSYTLRDADNDIIFQKKAPVSNQQSNISVPVKQPYQWNPEHPYLYELTTKLLQDGREIETIKQKIGFRQVKIEGNLLLVNGKPIKLRGVNRHSIYPLTGRTVSEELDIKDAVLFREGNCNYIRTSHYPPSEAFLNACDSLGLFVESESSLCWIEHGASPIWRLWNYQDQQFLPYMLSANIEKVLAQRHHPSIIIWSLGNESRWSPLWAKVNEVVKQLDPSRPTTFHDQCWGGFNNAHSTADIAVYHYPGLNGAAACDTMKRPVLFGEYAHISCYNRRELITDPGIREAYGAPLVQMYDSMYQHKGCLGGAIWSGIDDIFHMPDGRIIGYGPWGPIDAWRRTKPEYFGMKKAYNPVVVTDIVYPTPGANILSLSVENRFDFTNLKETKISYAINGSPKAIVLNVPPHNRGIIHIPVDANTNHVSIVFADPRGFVVNEENIVLKDNEDIQAVNVPVSFTENEEAITVKQGEVEYLISKLSGVMLSAKKQDKLLISRGPVFGITPMSKEDGDKPNVAGETYQNNIYPLKNYPLYVLFADNLNVQSKADTVKISMNIVYNDGSRATQGYCFSKDGTVLTEYEVQYRGSDTLPRQYGMMLQLPRSYDKLSWKRSGDFSVYPANDIGRTNGTAMMNARHLPSVEVWGVMPNEDWKDDANDLGSNDFRSTKRNIYKASLTDKTNNGVEIISGWGQSVRTWLQDEEIQLLVADYSNNGSEPFYGSPHSFGKISVKNKTLKGRLLFKII